MKARRFLAVLLTIVAGLQMVSAQKVILNFDDDQVIEYDVSRIKSMTFEEANDGSERITGVIIQGTECPMFGSFSIPANIRPNMLIAYYGFPFWDGEFPTYKDSNYTYKSPQQLSNMEIGMLKEQGLLPFSFYAMEPLLNDAGNPFGYEVGTAGKVYMTINPSTANLYGVSLSIVNSQDEESPIRLSPIRKSDTTLKSRRLRVADNGFYEADAYIDIDDILDGGFSNQEGINLLYAYVRSHKKIGDILQNLNSYYSLDEVATDIYKLDYSQSLVKDLDRNALKCTFTANGQEHSVYSQYNLMATAFEPPGLNLCRDFMWEDDYAEEDFFGPFLSTSSISRCIIPLSEFKEFPTMLDAEDGITLSLTTKTMEVIVPIARKHVAVTNVFKLGSSAEVSAQEGNADCLAKMKAANTGKFNTVLDGSVRSVVLEENSLESGYVYELAYSVLDFSGSISTQKYYITVK